VARRELVMTAMRPDAVCICTAAVSTSPASPIALSTSDEPSALTVTNSSPMRKRAMSKSWIIMSRNRPPEPFDRDRRRRGGIAADDGDDLDIADLAGADAPLQFGEVGVEAAVEADHQRRLVLLHHLQRQARWCSTSSDTGFSHMIALPALEAAWICSAWKPVGEPMSTASTSLAAMISSTLATLAPYWRPALRLRRARRRRYRPPSPWGFAADGAACTLPMRPAFQNFAFTADSSCSLME
jgi:hypothetical protein